MRFSRLGIFSLLLITIAFGANCSYYNRVLARKSLVDGGKAYKDRKFEVAEQLFRNAIARNPESDEGKTAQLFLARTLHSEYIGDRQNTARANEAIGEYKKVLAENPNDQSSFNAVANLLENLNRNDEWMQWVTARTTNEQIKPEFRAESLTKLAAKKYSCANDISDVEPVKKTITKDGKSEFVFSKPEKPEDFEQFKQCVAEGSDLINRAEKLDTNSDAVWSYKTNMLIQQARLAEMEGKSEAEIAPLKAEADKAKARFNELAKTKQDKKDAEEAAKKAKEEEASKKK